MLKNRAVEAWGDDQAPGDRRVERLAQVKTSKHQQRHQKHRLSASDYHGDNVYYTKEGLRRSGSVLQWVGQAAQRPTTSTKEDDPSPKGGGGAGTGI